MDDRRESRIRCGATQSGGAAPRLPKATTHDNGPNVLARRLHKGLNARETFWSNQKQSRYSRDGDRITGRKRFLDPLINQLFLALFEVFPRLAISWSIRCREVGVGLACARYLDRRRLQF